MRRRRRRLLVLPRASCRERRLPAAAAPPPPFCALHRPCALPHVPGRPLLLCARPPSRPGQNIEYVIAKSFSQFQHEQQLPQLESRLRATEAGTPESWSQRLAGAGWRRDAPLAAGRPAARTPCLPASHRRSLASSSLPFFAEAAAITDVADAAVAEYSAGKAELAELEARVRAAVQRPEHCLHFLRPGRIVRVTEGKGRAAAVRVDWLDCFVLLPRACCPSPPQPAPPPLTAPHRPLTLSLHTHYRRQGLGLWRGGVCLPQGHAQPVAAGRPGERRRRVRGGYPALRDHSPCGRWRGRRRRRQRQAAVGRAAARASVVRGGGDAGGWVGWEAAREREERSVASCR